MKKLFPLMALATAMFLSACGTNKGAETLNVKTKEEAQAHLVEKLTDTAKGGLKATIDAAATVEAEMGEFDLQLNGMALIGKGFTENYAKLTLGVEGEMEKEITPEEDDTGDEENPPVLDGEENSETEEGETTVIVPQTETVQLNDKVTLEGYLFKNKLTPQTFPAETTSEDDSEENDSEPVELKETYSLYGKLSDEHGLLHEMIPFLFELNETGYTEVYLNENDVELETAAIDDLGKTLEEEHILPENYKVDGVELTVEYKIPVQEGIVIPLQFTVKNDDITVKIPETKFTYVEKAETEEVDEGEAEPLDGETEPLDEEAEQNEIKVTLKATAQLKKGGQEELALKVAAFDAKDWMPKEETPTDGEDLAD